MMYSIDIIEETNTTSGVRLYNKLADNLRVLTLKKNFK